MRNSTKKLTFCALLAAVAILMGYVESLFPLPLPIPGARIGLGNAVVLLALLTLGGKEAAAILAVKVLLTTLLFGTPVSLLYAAAGGILALGGMALLGQSRQVSPIGQSIAGAVLHNLGQVLVAMALTATPRLVVYFTPLAFLAMLMGALSGVAAQSCAKAFGRIVKNR